MSKLTEALSRLTMPKVTGSLRGPNQEKLLQAFPQDSQGPEIGTNLSKLVGFIPEDDIPAFIELLRTTLKNWDNGGTT